jgi:membrane protease YdiL (CAAX protease family)
MPNDLIRVFALWAAWIAVTLCSFAILNATLPGTPPMVLSLWIVLVISVLVAAGVGVRRGWYAVGYTPPAEWRHIAWLALPAALTLLPLVTGIKTLDGQTYALLIAGYLLTGFAEETMFRGVLVKLLERRSPMAIAAITSILFGLVHLSNILIRGNPGIIAAQAVGAAAFGFGYAAIRQRTNALIPLVLTHMLTDLFLQMGNLPLIPVAVVQDVILFGGGLYLLWGWRRPVAAT